MAKERDDVPVKFFEIVDQGDSGFVLDGTKNTPYEQKLTSPTVSWIPADGVHVELDEQGIKKHKRWRHIKGCEIFDPKEQEKAGWFPNRHNDKIPFENGFATVRREGSTLATYDYLTGITYYADNILRPDSATILYREIKADERAVELIDEDELLTAAKSKVYALRINLGGEKAKFKYDESKIDSYCKLLNLFEETPERKLVLLLNNAMRNPRQFLNIIVSAENTVVTEISHALQLGVIMFDGNTAQYTKESKVITPLGKGNMAENKKIDALASYMQTPEGNNDLTELRIKLEAAKEEQFSK